MTQETCYACGGNATSVEHVPPRCLFPEQKDLQPGEDLRRQLITVPSCDVHNSRKSKDDEYLLHILVMNIPNNGIAERHFSTKILRSYRRNPSLIKKVFDNYRSVAAQDTETGEVQQTVAVQVDKQRFNESIENIGRAIYFHHFNEKWKGNISVHSAFLLEVNPDCSPRDINEPIERLAATVDKHLENEPRYGENKEVFFYQIKEGSEESGKIMRLTFYSGSHVTLMFA